jgi:Kef-type K+ transport system membrane component KefB
MKEKFKESLLIGGISFLAPFLLTFAYCYGIAGWGFKASQIAGTALSTTSLAVVYAVLVETGLTETKIGKTIMASCFVTDFSTALALSLLFAEGNWFTLVFVFGSAVIIFLSPKVMSPILKRYGNRVIEPEIKFLFFLLFLFMYLAKLGASHAVLPVFILGLVLSNTLRSNRELQRKLRIIAFAMITPFFFIKGGMNVSLKEIYANFGLLLVLFGVKIGAKVIGVYPLAKKYIPKNATYTTLLMSTGLTFGTISSMYGLSAGFINIGQFSVLVTVVILTAIVPTLIAQRWFQPNLSEEIEVSGKAVKEIPVLSVIDQGEGKNV